MLQNATPLRKSAPGPPNISDEHVSCTAPATQNASLQIFFNCLTETPVLLTFSMVQNPLRLPHKTTLQCPKVARTCALSIFTSKCASHHSGVHFLRISTSKSAPKLMCFVDFDFEMCFAPQRRALFHHRNFQK